MTNAVVCAYSLVGRKALEALTDCGIEVTALYTYNQPDEDKWFEAPAEYANRLGIPVIIEPNFNATTVESQIRKLSPDFLFSFYFREMIGAEILQIPKLGSYNLHGSLLPKYRGRAPINWVLVHGETATGITLHAMTPKPDDGDIFAQKEILIDWDETALSLTQKTAEIGHQLLREALPLLVNGKIAGTPQSTLGKPSYFGGRKPGDSRLSKQMTTQEAFNQIRAVADPWPNAFIEDTGGSVKIPWALPCDGHCAPGRFKQASGEILLGFADGPLRLVTLKKGTESSNDPNVQARWLEGIGVKEDV
jgi:methionyl-tRNA formyltransferase